MKLNQVKEKLKAGQPSVGVWINIGHPAVAEIMTDAGFEWLALDAEHAPFSLESLQSMLQAMSRADVVPMIRVPANDPVHIKQVLDLGPGGLIIPMVNTAEQARAAVQACRYPPEGIRGFGLGRASNYGKNYSDYVQNANKNLLVCIQIEHVEAVENAKEILAVDGIDAVFIGRADMAGSMGKPGGENLPEVWDLTAKVKEIAIKAGVAPGLQTFSTSDAFQRIQDGYRFVALGVDVVFLSNASSSAYRELFEQMRLMTRKQENEFRT